MPQISNKIHVYCISYTGNSVFALLLQQYSYDVGGGAGWVGLVVIYLDL